MSMFANRINTEKTRIALNINDSILLRLRTLLVLEHPGEQISLSEYLENYFESTLDDYIMSLLEEHMDMFDPVNKLLDSLMSTQSSCGSDRDFKNDLPENIAIRDYYLEGTC